MRRDRMRRYILVDRVPVYEPSLEKWGLWMETDRRKLWRKEVSGVVVSTVFLGLDHQFADGPPLLFETMVFGGALNDYMDRCSSYKQAEEMHADVCRRAFPDNVIDLKEHGRHASSS